MTDANPTPTPVRAAAAPVETDPTCASLQVSEIFVSIQGESSWAGLPCAFVRTTGCNLRCRWCDTEWAFAGGTKMSVAQIVAGVSDTGVTLVEITGGEPLLWDATPLLCRKLLELGCTVLVETGGSIDITPLPRGVHRIMDIKCPGSGEVERNLWSNVDKLVLGDEVKFVLADRADYEWAMATVRDRELAGRLGAGCVLMSPVQGELDPATLAAWMLEDRLPARFQLQLHRLLWPDKERGA